MRRKQQKCTCGRNNKIFCPNCSRIRMVIMLKNGNEELKINGYNPVWYSVLKYNEYDPYRIVEKMKDRFMKHPLAQKANVIQFYLNQNRTHYIHRIRL